MNSDALKKLFNEVKRGQLSSDEAVQQLRHLPFEDLGFANVDHHRALRVGMPEVIFGPGKTPPHLAEIFARLGQHGHNVLATRVSPEQVRAVKRKFRKAEFHELARAITLTRDETVYGKGKIVVVSRRDQRHSRRRRSAGHGADHGQRGAARVRRRRGRHPSPAGAARAC